LLLRESIKLFAFYNQRESEGELEGKRTAVHRGREG